MTVTRANTGKVALAKGMSYKLGAKASKGAKLTYKSSKKRVVTVSKKGKLKARKAGKATITVRAKRGKKAATKKVKVTVVAKKKYKKVKKLKLRLGKAALAVGKTTKAKVTFKPKKCSNRNVVYKSSDKKVATVSAMGKVTAKRAGTAKITVTSCANKKAKASKRLTVAAADKLKNPYGGPDSDGDGLSDALEAELGTDPQVANAEETLPNKDIYMPEVVQVEKAAVASAQVDEGSDPLSAEDDTITVSLSQLPDGVEEGAIAVFGPCEGLDHEQALKVSSIKGNVSKGWTVIGSAPDVDEVFAYTKGHETVRLDPSKATIADGSSVTSKAAKGDRSKPTSAKSKRAKSAAGSVSARSKMEAKDTGAEIGASVEPPSGDFGISLSTDGETRKGKVKTKYGPVSFSRDDEKTKVTFSFGDEASSEDGEDKTADGTGSTLKTRELSEDEEKALMSFSGDVSLTASDTDFSWAQGANYPRAGQHGTAKVSYEVEGDLTGEVSYEGEILLCSIPALSAGNDRAGIGLFVFLDISLEGKATLSLKCGADVTQSVTRGEGSSVQPEAALPQVEGRSPELSCTFEGKGELGLSLRLRAGIDGCFCLNLDAMAQAGVGAGVHMAFEDEGLLAGGLGPHGGGASSSCRKTVACLYLRAFAGLEFGASGVKLDLPEVSKPIWGDGSEDKESGGERAAYLESHIGTAALDSYYPGVGYKPTTADYSMTKTTNLITGMHADIDFTWNHAHLTKEELGKVRAAAESAVETSGSGWPMWDNKLGPTWYGTPFVNASGVKTENETVGNVSARYGGSGYWGSSTGAINLSDTQMGVKYSIDYTDATSNCKLLGIFAPGPEAAQTLDLDGFFEGRTAFNKDAFDTQAASRPFYLLLPLGEEDS